MHKKYLLLLLFPFGLLAPVNARVRWVVPGVVKRGQFYSLDPSRQGTTYFHGNLPLSCPEGLICPLSSVPADSDSEIERAWWPSVECIDKKVVVKFKDKDSLVVYSKLGDADGYFWVQTMRICLSDSDHYLYSVGTLQNVVFPSLGYVPKVDGAVVSVDFCSGNEISITFAGGKTEVLRLQEVGTLDYDPVYAWETAGFRMVLPVGSSDYDNLKRLLEKVKIDLSGRNSQVLACDEFLVNEGKPSDFVIVSQNNIGCAGWKKIAVQDVFGRIFILSSFKGESWSVEASIGEFQEGIVLKIYTDGHQQYLQKGSEWDLLSGLGVRFWTPNDAPCQSVYYKDSREEVAQQQSFLITPAAGGKWTLHFCRPLPEILRART